MIIAGIIFLCFLLIGITTGSNTSVGWSEITDNASFSPRFGHTTVVFNDKLWVIGGAMNWGEPFSDVWSSSDGKNWTLETDNAGFGPRYYHGTAVFGGRIWVIGGLANYTKMNDIWSSSDGRNWTRVVKKADFDPRLAPQVVVYKDRIWVIGGMGPYTMDDVWSSPDGINWTLQTSHAGFQPRYGAGITEFKDRLWVIGGYYYLPYESSAIMEGTLNDAWSSDDGCNWIQETSNGAFERREIVPLTVFDNMIWIIGGGITTPGMESLYNTVWSSADGKNWSLKTGNPGFAPRYLNTAVTFHNALWTIGGATPFPKNDVWTYQPINETYSSQNKTVSVNSSIISNETLPAIPTKNSSLTPVPTKSGVDPIILIFFIFAIFSILRYIQRDNKNNRE